MIQGGKGLGEPGEKAAWLLDPSSALSLNATATPEFHLLLLAALLLSPTCSQASRTWSRVVALVVSPLTQAQHCVRVPHLVSLRYVLLN